MCAPNTFCHACGAAYVDVSAFPRTCTSCGLQVWANPIPVSVVLVPVEHPLGLGLLVVRRGIEPRGEASFGVSSRGSSLEGRAGNLPRQSIEPGRGRLALVGGFLEAHETWQQGGAREVREETGVAVDDATLVPLWFTSTQPRPNRVLLFSVAAPLHVDRLGAFVANAETAERGLVFGPDGLEALFAFPLHVEAARRFFAERGIVGSANHVVC